MLRSLTGINQRFATSQNSKDLTYTAVEACNHAKHKMHFWFDISPEGLNRQPLNSAQVMMLCAISLFVTTEQYLYVDLCTANKVTLTSNQHVKMLQTFMEPELERPAAVQLA
jgi:hypothetical protein